MGSDNALPAATQQRCEEPEQAENFDKRGEYHV